MIFFLQWGVNPFGFGVVKTEHEFSLSRGYSYKTQSLALLESAQVLLSCFSAVSHCSAQAGSHCGIIQNFKSFCYVNVLHSLNLRCTFV